MCCCSVQPLIYIYLYDDKIIIKLLLLLIIVENSFEFYQFWDLILWQQYYTAFFSTWWLYIIYCTTLLVKNLFQDCHYLHICPLLNFFYFHCKRISRGHQIIALRQSVIVFAGHSCLLKGLYHQELTLVVQWNEMEFVKFCFILRDQFIFFLMPEFQSQVWTITTCL